MELVDRYQKEGKNPHNWRGTGGGHRRMEKAEGGKKGKGIAGPANVPKGLEQGFLLDTEMREGKIFSYHYPGT